MVAGPRVAYHHGVTWTFRFAPLAFAVSCAEVELVPPTVDDDPDLPALEFNGSRFHVVREGNADGVPIVFLAGGPGNDFAYLERLATTCDGRWLGDAHPLVWWDQRGCGRSRREPDGRLRLGVFREDLDALVDLVDPDAAGVILVGHSWGGMFAADFADRHPERVRGLALLEPGELTSTLLADNPTPDIVTPAAEWVNDFAWGQQLVGLDDHERLDFFLLLAAEEAQGYRVIRETPPNVRLGGAVIRQNFLGEFYPDEYDFTQNLGALDTEVLIIAGDTPTSDLGAALQRRQLDYFADATLEVFDGSGHTDVAWADGCRSATLVDAYLERVGAR